MILTRTPYRVSLFGGGSDYPVWSRVHGGRCLGFTINRYCHISVRALPPFFEHRSRVVWAKIETVASNQEITHPAIRACLELMGVEEGVEIHHDGDLPARSGLGSSSAFTVGLLHALSAYRNMVRPKAWLAEQAIRVEQVMLKEAVGVQDQIFCAHGGLQTLEIRRDGGYALRPLPIEPERATALLASLMLYFTGIARHASEVAQAQVAEALDHAPQLHRMMAMVDEAVRVLAGFGPMDYLGELLHEGWMLKRGLSAKITNPEVDAIYAAARQAGAVGGKLLGAGAGGFMLLYVPPQRQPQVRAALSHLLEVPFAFDRDGARLLLVE